MLRKYFIKSRLVGDVHVVECRAFAGNELDAVEALLCGIVQVINDDDVVASFLEGDDGIRTNVAAAAVNVSVVVSLDLPVHCIRYVVSRVFLFARIGIPGDENGPRRHTAGFNRKRTQNR